MTEIGSKYPDPNEAKKPEHALPRRSILKGLFGASQAVAEIAPPHIKAVIGLGADLANAEEPIAKTNPEQDEIMTTKFKDMIQAATWPDFEKPVYQDEFIHTVAQAYMALSDSNILSQELLSDTLLASTQEQYNQAIHEIDNNILVNNFEMGRALKRKLFINLELIRGFNQGQILHP